ncbi:hypothetical protein F5X99DRAFT_411403 [Biscogniauxia marginata]|nr:hypothetical protein F5X99DRAFT_411403 [Biscogniauxia marginata]
MDALKNLVGGNKSGAGTGNTNQQQTAGGQKPDIGDKVADFVSKKAGVNTTPSNREKVTDSIRGAYEKSTGSKVNPKFSN